MVVDEKKSKKILAMAQKKENCGENVADIRANDSSFGSRIGFAVITFNKQGELYRIAVYPNQGNAPHTHPPICRRYILSAFL